jgi:hypothetical protein
MVEERHLQKRKKNSDKKLRVKIYICVSPSIKAGLTTFLKNRENEKKVGKNAFFLRRPIL